MLSTRPAFVLLLLPLALTLCGCPRPLRFGPEGEITDANYLLRRLDLRSGALRSVKAEAKVSVKTDAQSGSTGQFVAVKRPGSMHLETLNFFGKPVAALASNGFKFNLFVEEGATFYSGPATAANVGRLLPVAIDPEEAVAVLLGDVLRLPGANAKMVLDRDARAYLVTLTRGTVSQRLWVGTEDFRLLRADVQGAAGLRVTFSDFQAFGDFIFPMEIEMLALRADGSPAGAEVGMRYKDVELNVALDPSLFALEIPPGARQVVLDADGNEVGAPPKP
ncbi:MAG: DUF4292 domain-containing protein [Myxococcales bacterium]